MTMLPIGSLGAPSNETSGQQPVPSTGVVIDFVQAGHRIRRMKALRQTLALKYILAWPPSGDAA